MTELARLLNCRLASEARLIEVAKTKQVEREISELADLAVLGSERHVKRAVLGIKSGERLLQVRARGQEFAELEAGRAA